jgi:transcriptional regulator with XRE-family HTH domain
MPLLRELGTAVRQRRHEMGLSQQQLAELVALSRTTVAELERGTLNDLSSNRVERLANELGFSVGLVGTRRPRDGSALEAAARVASVPNANPLPPDTLFECLRDGAVPPGFIPHLRTLLQEAPVAILADVADELERRHAIPKPDTWKRMSLLAAVLKCDRRLWQSLPT